MELLPQISFSILLALSLQPRHGYEIMQQVLEDSGGRIKLGPGALYGSIKQLRIAGLIEQVDGDAVFDRRRYYQLTDSGWKRLDQELQYFRVSLEISQNRKLSNLGEA
jgi:DNA-binding PadR family transcriptional regulator